ncbi:GNAT family N-acetyltransferase [Fusibacter bizertensis]|uniref:Aminoglycoside N(6')-acetyltransferase type 1 n=1 Tax=Fusibacter bizertensis TaxID=1488331 RepID=A0ABT6NAP6_9FIRM|nr:aminoglycoside 6'-N-acetyltransferase [Fusibacter bizertensis]MDH8677488.1 GNAT family N-acetyltransferase [Fusibacter bizertensis]
MKINYDIQPLNLVYLDDLTSMGIDLWPENEYHELRDEFEALSALDDQVIYLAIMDDLPIGFVHASLRNDYVEGATNSPVGYIEGIYVIPEFRRKNVSKDLVTQAQIWAIQKGCTQMASDIEDDNQQSQAFHQALGFREVNRLICYIKDIKE